MKFCAKCKRDPDTWDDPAEATGLFVGAFWNEKANKAMPYRGYLCDMHADGAEHGKFAQEKGEQK
jgi:hypothetical protein